MEMARDLKQLQNARLKINNENRQPGSHRQNTVDDIEVLLHKIHNTVVRTSKKLIQGKGKPPSVIMLHWYPNKRHEILQLIIVQKPYSPWHWSYIQPRLLLCYNLNVCTWKLGAERNLKPSYYAWPCRAGTYCNWCRSRHDRAGWTKALRRVFPPPPGNSSTILVRQGCKIGAPEQQRNSIDCTSFWSQRSCSSDGRTWFRRPIWSWSWQVILKGNLQHSPPGVGGHCL